MTLEEKIVQTLQDRDIEFEICKHEPVYTNPTMATALGVSEAETVKSLVLATKEKALVVLVCCPDRRSVYCRSTWSGRASMSSSSHWI